MRYSFPFTLPVKGALVNTMVLLVSFLILSFIIKS